MGNRAQSVSGVLLAGMLGVVGTAGQSALAAEANRAATTLYPAPNSDRARVGIELEKGDSRGLAWELERVRRERPAGLMPALIELSQRAPLPWSLREAAIAQFVAQLATANPTDVPPDALDLLRNWRSRTLVPHEESAALGTPLFNIAALTQGLENRWRREQNEAGARFDLRHNPRSLLLRWSAGTDPAVRAGILDALAHAEPGPLRDLARTTAAAKANPTDAADAGTATALAAAAAIAGHDRRRMLELVGSASGTELTGLLRELGRLAAGRSSFDLLRSHSAGWPNTSTALAIGLWSPQWAGDGEAESWLIGQLSDPELGAAAALALALTASDEGRLRLRSLAANPDQPRLAARARLALGLADHGLAP